MHRSLLTALAVLGFLMPPTLAAADQTDLPPDNAYVQIADGHLSLNGERVRYWGWIGHFWMTGSLNQYKLAADDTPEVRKAKIAKTYEVIDALAQRIHDLGFNLVRYWGVKDFTGDYEAGDGSDEDQAAYAFAALERRGIKLWMTAFNNYGTADAEADVGLIDDPATAEAWSAAVRDMTDMGKRGASPRTNDVGAWDPRMRAIHRRQMQRIADWPNKHKGGIRFGDDPQIAVWELSNEEWMFAHLVNGNWQKLPRFFVAQLETKWTDFLRTKYQDDAGLTQAWGFLLPGETLANSAVLLAPLAKPSDGKAYNDGNAAAIAALTAGKQKFSRDDFTRQRGSDVLEFFSQLQINYKLDRRDFARTLGKGLRLSPLILDTGDGFRIQSVHLHQHGDASAMCSYIWQTAIDRQQPGFPFMSGLLEQPRLAMGIPWMEVGRIPGKPMFIYEFQMNNPDKYRAEVPFRIAAMGAIQDLDIINFHLFGRPDDPADPQAYRGAINYSVHSPGWNGATVEGVHFKSDEIYSAAMKTAGYLFRSGTLGTPEKPTVMTFGRRSLYDPISAEYGRSFGDLGLKIAPTAWRHGVHMRIDPTQEGDSVEGKTVERGLMEANPVRPTPAITFDWQRGFLRMDAPQGVAWTGFLARQPEQVLRFENGIAVQGVELQHDEGVNYPVGDDERYVSFAVVAEDGLPLAQTKRAVLSLVCTSFNYGFKLDEDNVAVGDLGYRGTPYKGMTMGGRVDGKPAVAYVRAGATITSGPLEGMRYRFVDWHFQEISSGVVGTELVIPADQPIFTVELTR